MEYNLYLSVMGGEAHVFSISNVAFILVLLYLETCYVYKGHI